MNEHFWIMIGVMPIVAKVGLLIAVIQYMK